MNRITKTTTDEENRLVADLAALGYPGFSYLKPQGATRRVAEVLLAALGQENLDSRLVEALPWVVWQFPDLDWRWLISGALASHLQNRLGFITSIARCLAEQRGETDKARRLAQEEARLESLRLPEEDTLCHASLTQAERTWLRQHRPPFAQHWRLLTDLTAEQFDYAA